MTSIVRARNWAVEQKTRFDWGIQFLVFVNFSLLIITASDKLRAVLPIGTDKLLLILLPSAFIGTWMFGYFLDVVVKFPHQQSKVIGDKSPHLAEIIERLERIERKL